ncbi:MAG: hypothetical protein ACLQVJ_29285 [Syntrophobacteraceae bacterium]
MSKKQLPLFRCSLTLYDYDIHEAGWIRLYALGRTEPVGDYDQLIVGLSTLAQRDNGHIIEERLKQALDEQFFTIDEATMLQKYLEISTCLKDRFPKARWSPLEIVQFYPPIVEIDVRNESIVPTSWRNNDKVFDIHQDCNEYYEHVDFMELDPDYGLPFHLMAEVILRYPEDDREDISNEE